MKKRVLVSGCNGKMGQLVCSAIKASEDMTVVAGFDKSPIVGEFPIFSDLSKLRNMVWDINPNIIIDFSSPEATRLMSELARDFRIPIVIATTNLDLEYINMLKNDFSNKIPIFQSTNMSFDMKLFINLAQFVAKQHSDADIEILEKHHNQKKDTPSGTAKTLADAINEALGGTKTIIYGREGERKNDEIGISSMRGGNIIGEHTVNFIRNNEIFKMTHIATSREVFADGAIKAARFLLTKEEGFYNMDDLIASM